MADQIGAIGLDISQFESALVTAKERIVDAITASNRLNAAIMASAAAIAIWSKNFVDAKQKAEEMQKAIWGVSRALSAPGYNTESGLETRLKEVDSLLEKLSGKRSLNQVIFEKVSDFFTGKNTDKMENDANDMSLDKKREIEGQIADKIQDQTQLMKIQRQQGKDAVELERIRLEYQEKIGKVTAANGRITSSEYKALKAQEQEAIQAVLKRQQEVTKELQKQSELLTTMRKGNQTAARRQASEDDFEKRIIDANKNGNGPEAEELIRQREEARRGFAIEERNKTPAQRRAERRSGRKYDSDLAKSERENAELDDRIERGVRGSPGSRIERRRDINEENRRRARSVDNAKRAQTVDKAKSWGEKDSQNLQNIANAFANKGG